MLQNLMIQVLETQRQLHEQLIQALQHAANDMSGVGWILALSFLYGLFHAAGPGHGKVIVTTYLATHASALGRGVAIASLGAFCQGLTAIIVVYGLVLIVGSLMGYTEQAVDWSERLSFVLIFALGLWMLLRGAKALKPTPTHHHHDHDHNCCGHHHVPDESQVEKARESLGAMALVVFSMGLRPCTGAILILVFASVLGQAWLGVFGVLAMSAGTAMAVSMLAAATILGRSRVAALVHNYGSTRMLANAQAALYLAGGLVLAWLGGSLLYWSLNAPAHPLQL